MFKKIVFSKQADHSAELFPSWYRWYREVFAADQIIVTPVKTLASEVDRTIEFYGVRGCHVRPLEMPTGWQDDRIWAWQREIALEYLPATPFLVISADADQWFEPPAHLPEGASAVAFYRLNLAWDGPQPLVPRGGDRIGVHHDTATPAFGVTGGYVSCLDSPLVGVTTGHWRGAMPVDFAGVEFHVHWHGFDALVRKVRAMQFNADSGQSAFHWKHWRRVFDTQGADGLRALYDQAIGEYVFEVSRMTPYARDALERFVGYVSRLVREDRTCGS